MIGCCALLRLRLVLVGDIRFTDAPEALREPGADKAVVIRSEAPPPIDELQGLPSCEACGFPPQKISLTIVECQKRPR
jgi:hypothetical protein